MPGGEILDGPDSEVTGFDPATLALARSLRATQLGERAEKMAGLARELKRQRAGDVAAQAEISKIQAQTPLKQEQVEARRGLLEKGLTPCQQFLEMQQELIALESEGHMSR